ncbi:MAG: diguanylate cyclase [Burkholderiales bacterium]|nr:diguanylate cyclase [Burkholderiales bacterium]
MARNNVPSELAAGAPNTALLDKLQELERRYVAGLAEKFDRMQEQLEAALKAENPQEHLVNLHRQMHTLAGSAGTFGFPLLGDKAHQVEASIKDALVHLTPTRLTSLAEEVRAMLAWGRIDPKNDHLPQTEQHVALAKSAYVAASSRGDSKNAAIARKVYWFDEDATAVSNISLQLTFFGYQVEIFSHWPREGVKIDPNVPAVLLIDIGFPGGGMAGIETAAALRLQHHLTFPLVFTGSDPSFDARLAVVRAGGDSYFTKPVDAVTLTDRLDILLKVEKKRPYRILLVDDDHFSAEYYGALLSNAGMELCIVEDPQKLLQEMAAFSPELVLMDIYMPDCNGIELAKVLRQDNLYLEIPIVFLSTESNFGKQLDAIASGADDFITKPIAPDHLLLSVSNRVERYRKLRDLIMRDSLTGLFKHSTIKEHLERECHRAIAAKTALSLAMIDIDHFKIVNDNYGHVAGDQVIRSLSHLLRQRMRRCDIIGRYGGEEFAVIMPETTVDDAVKVLDSVRQVFLNIRHYSAKGEFSCSFSAGVVEFSEEADGKNMFLRADQALYQAKGNGRNRVQKLLG